ncbi:MAG: hypothetical protein COA88_05060 [Kordia sp.]|nr:MAG: hypothetical protein COA88_05060 [Kordia sp.]
MFLKNKTSLVALCMLLILLLINCKGEMNQYTEIKKSDSQDIVSTTTSNTVQLEQGWDKKIQQKFWFTTQGSLIIRYDWFLWLEKENSTALFRNTKNINKYKYIPQGPSELNPDGLPIGFMKNKEKGVNYVGINCAACHTGQVKYGETTMIIDGAPAMADYQSFFQDLEKAMEKTVTDKSKFERFAVNVLGGDYNKDDEIVLRELFLKATEDLKTRNVLNETTNPYGFSRVDAFGQIFNMVTAHDLNIPENKEEPNAPVSYPFLWDTPQSNLVQWNGLLSNHGLGPIGRNVGEVLGVFGTLDIKPGVLYPASAKVANLGKLEKWMESLWSPKWPEKHIGVIDTEKANAGKIVYANNCVSCHATIERTNPDRRVIANMTPLKSIGTDPLMALNATHKASTGILEGEKITLVDDAVFGKTAYKAQILTNAVEGALFDHLLGTVEGLVISHLDIATSDFNAIATPSYKARPLNGIWATAPYLHNGSVPNIWELLKPEAERVNVFYVGSRELDPKNIGFETKESKDNFKYDTSIAGNYNTGHLYGTALTEKEKWDLVEYMKTL